MRKRTISVVFGRHSLGSGAVLLALLLSTEGALASPEAAKRYFQNGVDLITANEPNYQDAYYQFQLAFKESGNSWKVLGNLGLCALKLERDQEAISYYEQYLQRGGSEIATEERQAIEQDLLLLRGNLTSVRITSSVPDIKIVDRRAGSPAPAQSYAVHGTVLELQLRAGNHAISAFNGEHRLDWDVVLEPKAQSEHTFDFSAAKPASSATVAKIRATGGPAGATGSGSDLRIPAFISLGVGAVGLGLGGYFAWQSNDLSNQSDAAFACDARLLGCTPDEKANVRQLERDSDSAKVRSIVSFAVGGASVVTGVVLLVMSRSASEEKTHASITPWLGPRSVGVSGTF